MTSVLVLHNEPLLPLDHPDARSEHSVVESAQKIAGLLEVCGFRASLYGLKEDPAALWTELGRRRPDVVFNMYEGTLHDGETESCVAGLLQWSGIPFTGSPLAALSLCRHKHRAKLLFRGAGLPTADFFVVERLPVPECPLTYPVIVKPAGQDASVGLEQDSVCVDQGQVAERVRRVLESYGPPVLVEEYIRGREIHVALMALPELRVVSTAEFFFPPAQPGQWDILTTNSKWSPGSADYEGAYADHPAVLSADLKRLVHDVAMEAFRLVGCRDYARLDMRVRDDQPFILEVNPNPEIIDSTGFSSCLEAAGITVEDFLVRLVRQAQSRKQ